MIDVALLTDERYVNPQPINDYINNVLTEDRLVMEALQHKGIKVKKVAWSDPEFEWNKVGCALFRTTWDYFHKIDRFTSWMQTTSKKTKFINSYDLILWNFDKNYLTDLKSNGINIVESYFIKPEDQRSLHELHQELKWDQTVLKPCISAAANNTFYLTPQNLIAHEERYAKLIKQHSMMLQPFQSSVVEKGEIFLMLIGGAYSHSVLKKAKPGDFRVQDDFGGTVEEYEPTNEEKNLVIRAVNACDKVPAYARVDIIEDNYGLPAVSELELIEPEMWFRKLPTAAELLAEWILNEEMN